jgi:hypothetical protein
MHIAGEVTPAAQPLLQTAGAGKTQGGHTEVRACDVMLRERLGWRAGLNHYIIIAGSMQ